VLDRAADTLLADLRTISGVRQAKAVRGEPYPAVEVDLVPGKLSEVEAAIEAACRRHGTLLFEMVQGREAPPDFGVEPGLTPLSASEAARGLVQHFKSGPRSALLRHEFGGSAARLYLALADLAAGMTCYRLDVGRLQSMVETIITTIARSSGKGERP
jgi:hypothetical protein